MKTLSKFALLLFAITHFFVVGSKAQLHATEEKEILKPKNYVPLKLNDSDDISRVIKLVIEEAISNYKDRSLKEEYLAVTVIDATDPGNLKWGHFRGEEPIYPASVVKMFYMAALYQQIEDGKIKMTSELERGLNHMIVTSSNEATQYIVDVLTDTASGGELPQKEYEIWSNRRNRMNRYFSSMGYININVNQKTHCEDAYGIEQQFRNYKGDNRNLITSNASAILIMEIALGRSVNQERSREMMELLKRNPFATGREANTQGTEFIGKAFIDKDIKGAKLWSKAGWTSSTRHDVAYIELPNGRKLAIAIYTTRNSNDKQIIPAIAGGIIEKLEVEKNEK